MIKYGQMLIIILFTLACKQKTNLLTETNKILSLHHAQKPAHINKDAAGFVNQFSDSMISVSKGKISKATKAEALTKFQSYFNAMDIKTWDDASPPVINFSDDASMAYVIVDKMVIATPKGTNRMDTTHFAWVSIYKKNNTNNWQIVCNASTNQ
jgi:hypothetical protein